MNRRVTDEQLAKLPQWAQRAITGYESDLAAIEQAITTEHPSDTFVANYSTPSMALPAGQRVRFYVDQEHTDTNDNGRWCLDVSRDRDSAGQPYVEVCQPYGQSPRIAPQSGNVLRIYVEEQA